MKKIIKIIVLIMMLTLMISNYTPVYAGDTEWIQKAFDAAGTFLDEDLSETDIHIGNTGNDQNSGENPGLIEKILTVFKTIVKALNTILLVLLAGLSTISLAITGVRYIMSKANPAQKEIAVNNLHTAFKGMFFGFGAYLIWSIAMSVVQIVIGMMASS